MDEVRDAAAALTRHLALAGAQPRSSKAAPAPLPAPAPAPVVAPQPAAAPAVSKKVTNDILNSAVAFSIFSNPWYSSDEEDSAPAPVLTPEQRAAAERARVAGLSLKELLQAACEGEVAGLKRDAPASVCAHIPILQPGYWEALAPGQTVCRPGTAAPPAWVAPLHDGGAALADVVETGYTAFTGAGRDVGSPAELATALPALVSAVTSLRAAGYPPVFAFVYDAMWQHVARLFVAAAAVLGPDVLMEPSIFAWALTKPPRGAPGTALPLTIGNAFTLPHRDYRFHECWLDGTTPALLNLWMPLTSATLENGCMYVVPRDLDPCFDTPEDDAHMKAALPVTSSGGAYGDEGKGGSSASDEGTTASSGLRLPPHHGREVRMRFDVGAGRPLPCSPGTVLAWTGNTIHWGSLCSARAVEARMSIAVAFRSPAMTESHLDAGDLPCLTAAEVRDTPWESVPLSLRLRLIIKGLTLFAWWFSSTRGVPEGAAPAAFWDGLRQAALVGL